MIADKTILLTGGAGFIGGTLALRLHEKNRIIILDNFHRNALKDEAALLAHPNVRVIKGSVMDRDTVDEAMKGVDTVIHLAAIAGVDTVMRIPVTTMQVGLIGMANVLDAAWKTGTVTRFIDFSTSEVFGRYAYNADEAGVTQLGAVGEARWTYAVSKLATEHLAHTYFKQFGLPTVSIRPFNIYGPGQVGQGAIHHFIRRALEQKPLTVHNDGSQIRSWCYISDILDGIQVVLERDEAVGHTFNIGNPRSTLTIYNLAREIVRLSSSSSPIELVEWPHADVELRIPNIDKARRILGYKPGIDLEEGLLRTIYWYRHEGGKGA